MGEIEACDIMCPVGILIAEGWALLAGIAVGLFTFVGVQPIQLFYIILITVFSSEGMATNPESVQGPN